MLVVKRTLGLFILLLVFSCGAMAQSAGGIKVKEEKTESIVYQIKVLGLGGPISAGQLDASMRTKRQILSAITDSNTGICTVEAVRGFDTRYFTHVLASHGLTMAKKFE
jgi:hypothetical protein